MPGHVRVCDTLGTGACTRGRRRGTGQGSFGAPGGPVGRPAAGRTAADPSTSTRATGPPSAGGPATGAACVAGRTAPAHGTADAGVVAHRSQAGGSTGRDRTGDPATQRASAAQRDPDSRGQPLGGPRLAAHHGAVPAVGRRLRNAATAGPRCRAGE